MFGDLEGLFFCRFSWSSSLRLGRFLELYCYNCPNSVWCHEVTISLIDITVLSKCIGHFLKSNQSAIMLPSFYMTSSNCLLHFWVHLTYLCSCNIHVTVKLAYWSLFVPSLFALNINFFHIFSQYSTRFLYFYHVFFIGTLQTAVLIFFVYGLLSFFLCYISGCPLFNCHESASLISASLICAEYLHVHVHTAGHPLEANQYFVLRKVELQRDPAASFFIRTFYDFKVVGSVTRATLCLYFYSTFFYVWFILILCCRSILSHFRNFAMTINFVFICHAYHYMYICM